MKKRSWQIFPHFILRSTGFSINRLQQLAFTKTTAALDRLLACEDGMAALLPAIQQAFFGGDNPQVRRQRRRLYRHLRHNRPFPLDEDWGDPLNNLLQQWNTLAHQYQALHTAAEEYFTEEITICRRHLRDLATDKRFQEAVWLSSPQMYHQGVRRYLKQWHPHKRPSHIRRLERQLLSYWQRFCTKNDTTAFFGPVNYGSFCPYQGRQLPGPGAGHVQQRQAYIAYWAVSALAKAIAADAAIMPYLQPQSTGLCQLDTTNNQLTIGHQAAVSLSRPTIRLLRLVTGQHTITQLAAKTKQSLEITVAQLQQLAALRAVNLGPNVPITTPNPLAWLYSWVEQLPDPCPQRTYWLQTLAQFQQIEARFANSSLAEKQTLLTRLEKRLSDLTGGPVRRDKGHFYADRLLIYEEALGGLTPLMLGSAFAAELEAQLIPLLDLLAANAAHIHQQQQAVGCQLLAELTPDDDIPFLQLVTHLQRQQTRFKPVHTPWQQAILNQLDSDSRHIQLDCSALPAIDKAIAPPLFASPDIMLQARDEAALRAGDFQLILSECHDTFMIWGWALHLHPQAENVKNAAKQMLVESAGDRALATILASKRTKIIPFDYPGPTIQMMASVVTSAEPVIPVSNVRACRQNDRLFLKAPDWPELTLHNGELHSLAHMLFALPQVVPLALECGEHTPRISLGNAVLQREQWRLPRASLFPDRYQGTSFALIRDFHRIARTLGLPRYLFARVADEPKPVFIDCHNYFLLELLHYLIPEKGEVHLSEMLPSPDQLWLQQQSEQYCAELRLSACFTNHETIT